MNDLETLYNRKRILEESIAEREQEVKKYIYNDEKNDAIDEKIKEIYSKIKELENTLKEVNKVIFDIEKTNADKKKLDEIWIRDSRTNVMRVLGIDPDALVITGGVLSPNASESHELGHLKTKEELEVELEWALNEIKRKRMANELSLSEASKLKNDVELVYNSKIEGLTNERHV